MSGFATINDVATYLRSELEQKKYLLLFAYNGTGKTRLSMAFKDIGKQEDSNGSVTSDTLYFNAFTEDLFTWDNDLDGDSVRVLKLNSSSRFFAGLESLEMETRIRPFLHRYVDFDFVIDYKEWLISFSRKVPNEDYDKNPGQERERVETNIKISRGEENIFIWCFFLAIVEIAMDKEIEAYQWVKYVYIDDPVSSLDENNIIAIAHHLAQLLKRKENPLKAVLSSHHTLFFNVMWNELDPKKNKQATPYFISKVKNGIDLQIKDLAEIINALNEGSKTNVINKINEAYPDKGVTAQTLSTPANMKNFILEMHETSLNPVQMFLDSFQGKLQGGKLKVYKSIPKKYSLKETGDTPFFHHVATLVELYNSAEDGDIYTHHFNTLRTILEKSACFHGFNRFSSLIEKEKNDPDDILYARLINVLNHGNYSLYEPMVMMEENKIQFKRVLETFMKNYTFNPELFIETQEGTP